MSSSRKKNVDGVVLLDKPVGLTSNKALQIVKRLYGARKAGHTGSLDPLASGLLPICMGEATKMSAFLLDADKCYRVHCRLGEKTATGDAEGKAIAHASVPELRADWLESVLSQFEGPTMQVPPMYSALKHHGRRLYELAREGVEVERAPRPIVVHEIKLRGLSSSATFEFDVTCSKGTYVRTLAEDIAAKLGTCGHVIALRRVAAGPYNIEQSLTLGELETRVVQDAKLLDAALLPVASAIMHWPKVVLNPEGACDLRQGRAVQLRQAPRAGCVRIYLDVGRFLGVGEIQSDGRVAPRRLIRQEG